MSTGVAIIGFVLWFVAGVSLGKTLGTQERIKLFRLRKSVPGAVQTVEVLSAYVIYRASNGCQLPYAKTDEIGLYGHSTVRQDHLDRAYRGIDHALRHSLIRHTD